MRRDFPQLFRIAMNKDGVIRDMARCIDGEFSWEVAFRRSLRDWEEEEYRKLIQLLQEVRVDKEGVEDSIRWVAEKSGLFSVRSMYDRMVVDSRTKFEFSKLIWENSAPPRVQFFGWLVVNGRVKTGELLIKRGILLNIDDGLCCFCKSNLEDIDHMFLHCDRVWWVWF